MADEYRANDHDRKFDPACCKAGFWSNERWSRYSQCSRKPVIDGWCKQHSPEAEEARERQRKERADAEQRKWDRAFSRPRDYETALQQIADGHNDPRTLAREALEKWRTPHS